MTLRLLLLAALLALVAAPFALRPRHGDATAEDTVVVITPHNEAIRAEFGRAFAGWYQARTGRTVRIDWRVVGGTSDIARYLESAYAGGFEREWTSRGRTWSAAVQAGFQDPRLPADAPSEVRAARAAFLSSDVGCGVDVFFGGDAYQFGKEADAGHLVASGLRDQHPEWFTEAAFPARFGGEPLRDAADRWYGVVLSAYGIVYNPDAWNRTGIPRPPEQWSDLGDPRLVGQVALADPTKSGSVCEAFENMIQQQIQRRLATLQREQPAWSPAEAEHRAVRQGWEEGLQLIQRLAANARYFTDASQKPPMDVAAGDCAAGVCIDFYGRQEQDAIARRGDARRVSFVMPAGGSAVSTDPIGLLRGAPHRATAAALLEFVLSLEGQRLWAFAPGAPGGPVRFALRRMPVRRDFYSHREWRAWRSDPDDEPYAPAVPFVYHPEWTGALFREIGFVTRVLGQDSHDELVAAWRAIQAAPEPARSRALARLADVSAISYDETAGPIHRALSSRDRVAEVELATELGRHFRAQYAAAAELAQAER